MFLSSGATCIPHLAIVTKSLSFVIPGFMGACLSCLDTWKVTAPSVVPNKAAVGKLILVKKISGECVTLSISGMCPLFPLLPLPALDAKAHIPCLKADIATLSRIPPHPLFLNLLGVCNTGGQWHTHTHSIM